MTCLSGFKRRQRRTRYKLKASSNGQPRLSVFRSNKHIYAQIIDDLNNVTLVSASTVDTEIKGILSKMATKEAAAAVGKVIAERAIQANVTKVVFDRGGCIFHGRVKELADAAKSHGLKF